MRQSSGRMLFLSMRAMVLVILVAAGTALPAQPVATAQSTVQVSVYPDGDRHPISPWIYGVNYNDELELERSYPLVRWGGNHTTRYSWEDDVANRAHDWFFMNIPYDNPDPDALPAGSTVDRLAEQLLCQGGDLLLTVPTIGWTPHDRERRWGFSVIKYGTQQQTAPGDPDAGNGIRLNGSLVTGNDPTDTSRAVDASFARGWLTHLAGRFGDPGDGGMRLYALDNEPMRWHETHRDVHPNPMTYDEIWSRTVEYASAIKDFDPDAQILGPVVWGWCAYWSSAADQTSAQGGCGWGPDRQAHGNVAFLLWYLQQICAYESEHGVRLVDYLDVHYYPASFGVALTDNETSEVADRRLRSVRSLNDPEYVDESWIAQSINLIPMLQGIVAENCPGLGVAVSEYNWGNDEGATSALAQAEVLAIFGQEGLDLAARWLVPKTDTAVEDAFLLYLDYDGAGSRVVGDSVEATSDDEITVPAYAVADDLGRVYTLLFNKSLEAVTAEVTSSTTLVGEVEVFGFDGETRLGPRDPVEIADGAFVIELPARSVTLAVASDGTPLPEEDLAGDSPSDAGYCFDASDAGDEADAGDIVGDLDGGQDGALDGDPSFVDANGEEMAVDLEVDALPGDLPPDTTDTDTSLPPDLFSDSADGSGVPETDDPPDEGCACSLGSAPAPLAPFWPLALAFLVAGWNARRRCKGVLKGDTR